jgi:hypothetical protein
MPASDSSEKGLENLIVAALTRTHSDAAPTGGGIGDPSAPYGGACYVLGDPKDYDRDHAVDLAKLLTLPSATTFKSARVRTGPSLPSRESMSTLGSKSPKPRLTALPAPSSQSVSARSRTAS